MTIRLGDIDFKKKPIKPQVFLCKPNKEIIAKMNESYNISFSNKLGALNELTFTLPVFIDQGHELIRNNNADKIRGRYLIKLILDKYVEYFMVTQVEKIGDDSKEEVNITCLSLGFEMNDKLIRDYKAQSKTATELLNDLLINTNWKVGYVDSEFDLKRRGLEVSSSTVLEQVFEVATTFNALVSWKTATRQVDLLKPDLTGLNKGFEIKLGRYLESLNQEDNSEEIITRMKMYGKEDITIREINPTGTTYIEDLSYFIYPYKEVLTDDGYEVISHSDFDVSDELCHHILRYDKLLEEKNGAFQTLVAERVSKNGILNVKEGELRTLNVDLKILLDQRDVLNTRIAKMEDEVDNAVNNKQDTVLLKSNLASLKAELNLKLIEIELKKSNVSSKEAEVIVAKDSLQGVLNQVNSLKELLALENNFSPALLEERNQFIIEHEWQDSNIDNAEDLLIEGKKVFAELKRKKITLKAEITNFLSMVTEQVNWDKLELGDIILIEQERLRVSYEAKLTEVDYDFENETISVTISNIKDLANKDKFLDMLYKGYSSSTQVSIDKWKWDLSMENEGSINQIINNFWDANKQAIIGAKDQVIELSDRGLIIRDPNDPLTYLVGLNGMIAITNDGGNTWKHAITGNGIVGERIYGKVIMGTNLAIEDEHGIVKWQGSLGEIFDRNGKLVMKMGLVEENPDTFGLWSFNDITRVKMDDSEGFVIDKATTDLSNHPDGWEKILWADQSDGTLYSKGLVAESLKIVNNIGEAILDSENGYLDIGKFETIVMDNKFTTIEKMQIITELYKIESQYKRMLEQAEEYKRSQRDDIFDIDSQFFAKTPSVIDLYSTTPLINAYNALLTYMEQFIKIVAKDPLNININDPLTETTSEIASRSEFILKFKNYYDEEKNLRNKIEDALSYSGINMGQFYNNVTIGQYGVVALRNDGKYRSILNATNGLALQKWETDHWVNKVYGSIGNSTYEDGTLIAEDLVAKRLRIETSNGDVLLDVNSLQLDFSKLDSIILDDVIVSTEKISLLNQFKTITKQYIELKETIVRYATTIYNDRDSIYYGLTDARDQLVAIELELRTAYDDLNVYMTPVFVNMNSTTRIVTDLGSTRLIFHTKWENFYKSYESGRSKLADFLEKSTLQLGRNYNNTVIDAENGIVVTRGNITNRTTLNATEGIAIEANVGSALAPVWVKKFYAGIDGKLYAEDLTAIRLNILSGDGDLLIDGDARKLYLNKFDIIGAGLITSEHIVTNTITADNGYIADLTVNHLKTLAKEGDIGSYVDYIDIENNEAKWITGRVVTKTPAKDSRGNALYWKEAEKKYLTTDATSYIAYSYEMAETEKLRIAFEGSGQTSYPYSIWGAGDGVKINQPDYGDSARGYIYKLPTEFSMKYNASNSGDIRQVKLSDTGIDITAINQGITVKGKSIDLISENASIQIGNSSGSRIGKNDAGDSIKLSLKNGNVIELDNSGLNVNINGDINLNATGYIQINGSRVDIN
ncbi:hypothetical protein FHS16_004562 [Paenibacillus endophyticus]|uniref:Prophage tail endopeptidase domain-containing protein n=1 Tax=Paenibacillus endophyticus TaxID=1294268 RepID=A0A7W5GC50_9BACL|nr:phage tail protein [Paenibacillus endophyticus]MBB3154480.1 hypothetical protein [Paenibacillus endophyticus]